MDRLSPILKKNSPAILALLGSAGVIATVYTAITVTPKAVELVKEDSRKNHDGDPYGYTKLEAVKSSWKCYIPTIVLGVSTIVCIISSSILSANKQAALTGAYALIEQSYKKYKKSANIVYGEDADKNIKEQMAKSIPVFDVAVNNNGIDEEFKTFLFYDDLSQRYFKSTFPAVLNAKYYINRNIMIRGEASLNEFYRFLGFEETTGGDEIGWTQDKLYEDGIMWLDFEIKLTTSDGNSYYTIYVMSEPIMLND